MPSVHYFGIRHHGPGCARSLLRAFTELRPDCVLIEGPPEADALLSFVRSPELSPPVALLTYSVDEQRLAVFHPFAEFSPEWQAAKWATTANAAVRFIDLPVTHSLALDRQRRDAAAVTVATPERPHNETVVDAAPIAGEAVPHMDPLDWFATAAGYADGEAWWNHMVEERGDGEELFAAIAEAMAIARNETGDQPRSTEDAEREALREAHMRQSVRAAQKEGFERIAVVCGAWHVSALRELIKSKDDLARLKGLPKLKVQSTWVPWTYRHLTRASGYGAGIKSPGWYEHLWQSGATGQPRAIGWLARVARLLRERDLDCSSAHLIEALRLADSLSALRERPAPGLDELHEATRTVLMMGDESALRFIDDALVVGDRLGAVPQDVPTVPLQRDLEQAQKTLRLKAEATQKVVDLDLRNSNDLARSHLLHRLNLLDVPWGALAKVGHSSRGTFHEVWSLQWQPEYVLKLIDASQWGQTVAAAATARAIARGRTENSLPALATLIDSVLLADLDTAVADIAHALDNLAAHSSDTSQLLAALPPLANIFRYGNVRQIDATMVSRVLDGLIARAAIGLPLACQSIDDGAAEKLRDVVIAAHAAVALRDSSEHTVAWSRSLDHVAQQQSANELLKGLACRLLLDEGEWNDEQAARALSLHMSSGSEPSKAAAWLDGFLNRNATVLLHDAKVWRLVDAWLAALSDDHFVRILPLLRRTFSAFASGERQDLGALANRNENQHIATTLSPTWDESRAAQVIPLLRKILGVPT
ncbi:MAG TPA: DUF5682 family protein [Casimicrobium sp.]|nr:DUF5682 family protein [Casimicrobium sp.]